MNIDNAKRYQFKKLSITDAQKMADLTAINDFKDGYNYQMLSSGFSIGGLFAIGGYLGDKLIAYITYTFNGEDGEIQDVLVDKFHRKNGVGKSLVEMAVSEFEIKRTKKIFLEVRNTNQSAYNLYSKCKFYQIGVRKKYYSDLTDAIIMQRDL